MRDALDRGLLYGDAFFTTLLVEKGQLANWPAHWRRLQHSAQRLKFPALSEVALRRRVAEIVQTMDTDKPHQVIKILISRGQGGKGYQPLKESQPAIYVQALPFPQGATQNAQAWPFFTVKMKLSTVRWGQQPLLAGLKHCNRLENVLAREALLSTDFDEALMLGQQGQVISASQANLVLIKGNQLVTPELSESGVLGTCLSSLPKVLASVGKHKPWQWQIRPVTVDEVYQAEEVFCCNAIRGVMPVSQFEAQSYPIKKSHQIAQAWQDWQSQNLISV